MNNLILGAVVSQIGGAIGARYCLYAAMYFKEKVMYWYKFRKFTKIQRAEHQRNYKNASSNNSFAEAEKEMDKLKKLSIFAGVIPDYNPVANENTKAEDKVAEPTNS